MLNIWLSLTGFDWHSHLPTHEESTPAMDDVLDAGAGAGAADGKATGEAMLSEQHCRAVLCVRVLRRALLYRLHYKITMAVNCACCCPRHVKQLVNVLVLSSASPRAQQKALRLLGRLNQAAQLGIRGNQL